VKEEFKFNGGTGAFWIECKQCAWKPFGYVCGPLADELRTETTERWNEYVRFISPRELLPCPVCGKQPHACWDPYDVKHSVYRCCWVGPTLQAQDEGVLVLDYAFGSMYAWNSTVAPMHEAKKICAEYHARKKPNV
jgi:hypothetical protein